MQTPHKLFRSQGCAGSIPVPGTKKASIFSKLFYFNANSS
jgi:hypothetical protein